MLQNVNIESFLTIQAISMISNAGFVYVQKPQWKLQGCNQTPFFTSD